MTRWSRSAGLKYRPFSTRQCTGHHDTDKWTALKVSPSPNLLTKCPIRSRRICVVWWFINGAVTCTLNVTCALDLALLEETFSWRFSQNSEEEKISKASYQTIPVSKSTLGLQLVFHKIVFFFIGTVRKPKRKCSIRSMEFPKITVLSNIWYHLFNIPLPKWSH